MATIRKRRWTSPSGEQRECWQVGYHDQHGKRRHKQFRTKKDADAWLVNARYEVKRGVHVAASDSITVAEAAKRYLRDLELDGREPETVAVWENTIRRHVLPYLGTTKLAQITTPMVTDYKRRMQADGRTPFLVRRGLRVLRQVLNSARLRGEIVQNPAAGVGLGQTEAEREGNTVEVGVTCPTTAEVRAMLAKAKPGFERTFVLTLAFTGMRSSEARGLRWQDVDFDAGMVRVRQRADAKGRLGPPKSKAGKRDIPVARVVVNTLKEWKIAADHTRPDDLVFATRKGRPLDLSSLLARHLHPMQERADVVDDAGRAKYGTHALRHYYATICISPVSEGGLGYSPKRAQTVLGHASITMTYDVYGHLLPKEDNAEALANMERSLLG